MASPSLDAIVWYQLAQRGGQPPDFWWLGFPLAPGVNPLTLLPRSPERRVRAGEAPTSRSGLQTANRTTASCLIFWIIFIPGAPILEL